METTLALILALISFKLNEHSTWQVYLGELLEHKLSDSPVPDMFSISLLGLSSQGSQLGRRDFELIQAFHVSAPSVVIHDSLPPIIIHDSSRPTKKIFFRATRNLTPRLG